MKFILERDDIVTVEIDIETIGDRNLNAAELGVLTYITANYQPDLITPFRQEFLDDIRLRFDFREQEARDILVAIISKGYMKATEKHQGSNLIYEVVGAEPQ